MLAATLTRDGEPVAYVFGPQPSADGGAVFAGVFMARQGLEADALDFEGPDGARLRLRLPAEAIGLTADGYAENLTLEVIPV